MEIRRQTARGGRLKAQAMVAIAIFNPFATKFGALSFTGLSLNGNKVTMASPKLAGFRSDGQPIS